MLAIMTIRMPHPPLVSLISENGDREAIIEKVASAMERAGFLPEEIAQFVSEAESAQPSHVRSIAQEYIVEDTI